MENEPVLTGRLTGPSGTNSNRREHDVELEVKAVRTSGEVAAKLATRTTTLVPGREGQHVARGDPSWMIPFPEPDKTPSMSRDRPTGQKGRLFWTTRDSGGNVAGENRWSQASRPSRASEAEYESRSNGLVSRLVLASGPSRGGDGAAMAKEFSSKTRSGMVTPKRAMT